MSENTPAPPALAPAEPTGVCPGQRNLMPGKHPVYLRAAFGAYWHSAPPSFEVFYFPHVRPFWLTLEQINSLGVEAMRKLTEWYSGSLCTRAEFLGFVGVELAPSEVTDLGWRVYMPKVD